jgi:hypothetical protein
LSPLALISALIFAPVAAMSIVGIRITTFLIDIRKPSVPALYCAQTALFYQ